MQAGEEGVIANLCKVHAYLLESDRVDPDDRALFAKLKSEKADRGQLVDSLQALIRMMYAHYGKPVILLIDEYDVPLAKAHDADKGGLDYYPKMLDTIRGLIVSGSRFEVVSNQEHGLGRTDIVVKDRKNRRAVIIEAKKSVSEQSLEKDACAGRQQIIDKQ